MDLSDMCGRSGSKLGWATNFFNSSWRLSSLLLPVTSAATTPSVRLLRNAWALVLAPAYGIALLALNVRDVLFQIVRGTGAVYCYLPRSCFLK